MTNISISLEGIDHTIANLNYRPNSIKQRAIMAIRAFYASDEAIRQLDSIDTDILVKSIWDVGENLSKIKAKRKNFSTIKSSINADLEKLSQQGQNNESITITASNIFDISQEAKNSLFSSFSNILDLGQEVKNNLFNSFTNAFKNGDIHLDEATDLLKSITEFLKNNQQKNEGSDMPDKKTTSEELEKDELVDGIDKDDNDTESVLPDKDEQIEFLDDDVEEIEIDEEIEQLDEEEEIQEVDGLEELEEDEQVEIIDEDDMDTEDVLLDEDEQIELLDDDLEEIDDLVDDLEELEDNEQVEVIDEDDMDAEELLLDEDEQIELLDDDIEEIELDKEIQEVEDFEEIEELDEDEINALEEFRKQKELAQNFDNTLGEREKKYNKYITVPGGKYTIGTKKGLKFSMELQEFDMPKVYMGAYPVCNFLFEIFIEQTGYITTAEKSGYGRVYKSRLKKESNGLIWKKNAGSEDVKGACWYQPSGPGSSLHGKRHHPVVQVSVEDAVAFSAWIGRRIPTEAEWEAAARTDLGYRYPWGNEFKPDAFNIEQSGLSDTCAVDQYEAFANEFKIVDMLGNVMEWTSDMQKTSVVSNKNVLYCVAKGAAWNSGKDVTIGSRGLFKAGFTSNTIGFRCISEIFA